MSLMGMQLVPCLRRVSSSQDRYPDTDEHRTNQFAPSTYLLGKDILEAMMTEVGKL